MQSLIANEDFQHILRVLNTNVDGRQKIMFALTSIKGVGRRFANLVCKKADVDMSKRCGLEEYQPTIASFVETLLVQATCRSSSFLFNGTLFSLPSDAV